MIYGLDTLAIAKYPELLNAWPKGFALGVFWETFGSAKSVIETYCKRGLGSLVRVHGQWSDIHNFDSNSFKKAISIGQEINKLANQYPNITFQYSPFCEDKLSASVKLPIFRELSKKCPKLVLVNTSMSGGQYVPGVINEIHNNGKPAGSPNGPINFSYDGLAGSKTNSKAGNGCVDSDVKEWKAKYANAQVFWFWVLQFNMKQSVKDETPRPARKCKPTPALLKSIAYYAGAKSEVKLADGWLYKSHSEQHQDVDPRASKPVILGPKGRRFNKVEVFANGRLVARFVASGTTDNRQVWRYNSKHGFELGRFLTVKANNQVIGTIDGGYRQNEYKNG